MLHRNINIVVITNSYTNMSKMRIPITLDTNQE